MSETMDITYAKALHRAVSSVCPIDGINSTGEIAFRPEATDAQRAAAIGVLSSYDPLADTKTRYCEKVDLAAEAARARFITMGSGQALEYQAAAVEARAFQVNAEGAFPLLQASVDAGEVETLAAAAELVLARESAWMTIGAEIRRARLAAKLAIKAAATVEDAESAFAAVAWPTS